MNKIPLPPSPPPPREVKEGGFTMVDALFLGFMIGTILCGCCFVLFTIKCT